MRSGKFICLWIALLLCNTLWANKVTETLESPLGDRVTITYDVNIEDGVAVLNFIGASKTLGATHARKYNKLEEVAVVFFDYIGVYSDGTVFKGDDIKAFTVPAGLRRRSTSYGYYLVQQEPSISFELIDDGSTTLTIPVFLAHYERKLHYKVFASCGELKVKIDPTPMSKPMTVQPAVTQTSVEIIEEEIESLSETDAVAIKRANNIVELLSRQEEYPFEEYLTEEVRSLRKQRSEVKDDNIVKMIDDILAQYDAKEKVMKAEHEKKVQQQQQAVQDSIKKEQEREAQAAEAKEEEQKKRNLWMLIGGAIMAVLLFVGGQVMQTIRNRRTQRSMMQMQQDAAKQAEGIARRKAQSTIKSKTNQAINAVDKKSKAALQKSVDKTTKGKGNKRISI